jgi:hypothetical protein
MSSHVGDGRTQRRSPLGQRLIGVLEQVACAEPKDRILTDAFWRAPARPADVARVLRMWPSGSRPID